MGGIGQIVDFCFCLYDVLVLLLVPKVPMNITLFLYLLILISS